MQCIYVLMLSLLPAMLQAASSEIIPSTLSEYRETSEDIKVAIQEKSRTALKRDKYHPMLQQGGPETLSLCAARLRENFPDGVFFCIGQSPAYIMACGRLEDELEKKDSDRWHHIIFSGKWVTRQDDGCYKQHRDGPTPKGLEFYRTYLTRHGMSPKHIIERFEQGKKRTVIVDVCITGEGLYSFLEILSKWAEELHIAEQMRNAMQIGIFQAKVYQEYVPPIDSLHDISATKLPIASERENEILKFFGSADGFVDRLVPYYTWLRWDEWIEGLDPFPLGNNAKYVLFALIDHLMKKRSQPSKID